MPVIIWVVLLGARVITIGFSFLFGTRNTAAQLVISIGLALTIALVMLSIMALEQPFAGITRVQPQAFEHLKIPLAFRVNARNLNFLGVAFPGRRRALGTLPIPTPVNANRRTRGCHPAVGRVRPQGSPALGKHLAQENVVGRPVDHEHDAIERYHVEQLVDLEEAALLLGEKPRRSISTASPSPIRRPSTIFSGRRIRSRGSGRRSHGGAAPSRQAAGRASPARI